MDPKDPWRALYVIIVIFYAISGVDADYAANS